jgi:hypothetical protein
MKRKKVVALLEKARRDGSLFRINRARDTLAWGGFVVGLGDEWMLLHELDGNWMRLNGYIAFRVQDIERVKPHTSFAARALELCGERAFPQPDILLLDLPGLLSSADAHFPLVTIHLDDEGTDSFRVGRVQKTTEKTVTLRKIDVEANWVQEPERFRLRNITRVEFGGGYETALWQVAEKERRLAEREIDEDE